jgi:predicted N-acetyltransferase YhbS
MIGTPGEAGGYNPAPLQERNMTAPAAKPASVTIRRATPNDVDVCGAICYEAFAAVTGQHNFPPDLPSVEAGRHVMGIMFSHPGFFCVVAEQDGKIVGSNCLDERDAIAGIGPITIDPAAQNAGVGRLLMQAAMDRVAERKFAGVRLLQAAFQGRSLSLYAKLGFDIQEPIAIMQGPAIHQVPGSYTVRPAQASDLAACNALCQRIHGHDRGGELSDAIQQGEARVAEHNGRIAAYASTIAFFGHSVAETNEGLQALIGSAEVFGGPGFLLPLRNTELFRWCLHRGLRVVYPMTLMTVGLYNTPRGPYLPSVSY